MSSQKYLLEICCYSLNSCLEAEKGGATRIELCSGMPEGGTTPSFGLIKRCLQQIGLPIFIMIRPRGGDFCYSPSELSVMLADIEAIKSLKPAGFVFGALQPNGQLHINQISELINAAKPFAVTFHRAFDRCADPLLIIEQLTSLGVNSILTSGQQPTAKEGINNLKKYVKYANNRINIIAASGVHPTNIKQLAEAGLTYFHFSAKKPVSQILEPTLINMGLLAETELLKYEVDYELVKQAVSIIEKL